MIPLYGGLPVKVSDQAIETTTIPRRVHLHRHGQSLNYHNRIQKKWIKRFGYETLPAMFNIGGRMLVVHPAIMARLRAEGAL